MGDLKGLLDKEGIDIGRPLSKIESIPTLTADLPNNELISHFEEQLKNQPQDPDPDPVNTQSSIEPEDTQDNIDLPVLDGTISVVDESVSPDIDDYIADMDDDDFDVMEFAGSVEDLEQKVQSITQPEDLLKYEEQAQPPLTPQSDVSQTISETAPAPLSQTTTVEASNCHPSFNDLTDTIHFEQLKEKLHKQLSFQIELSIAEFKSKLLNHLEAELDAAFKK